jgi:hypothetical protein
MNVFWLQNFWVKFRDSLLQRVLAVSLVLIGSIVSLWLWATPTALAGLEDDRYDGNIFALYAGNGSLVPPKVTLSASLKRDKATFLVLYVDDNSDCKQYSQVISRVQAYYGRAMDILPVRVDSLIQKDKYEPTEPGYYYQGFVPQTVIFDVSGKLVLNEAGVLPYERIDDTLRKVFDLLPRSESAELKRRAVNEINTEIAP